MVLGDAAALGSGVVTLKGGTLDLNDQDVANEIVFGKGTTLMNISQYAHDIAITKGSLTIVGDVNRNISLGKSTSLNLLGEELALGEGQAITMGASSSVKGSLSLDNGASLEATGKASLTGTLTLNGATLSLTKSGISVKELVTEGDVTKLILDDVSLSKKATYKLISYKASELGADFEIDLPTQEGYRNSWTLVADNKALSLVVDPGTQTLTWNDDTMVWGIGASEAQWTTKAADKAFYHGDKVVFSSEADVHLINEVAPLDVMVQGKGDVSITGDGSITGEGGLVMKGKGTLTISTANSYTGGTTISSGTVCAGDDEAFGCGGVTLKGGTLDLDGHGIANEIATTGNSTLAGAENYSASLNVNKGTLTLLSDTAGDIVLAKGASLARKESSSDKAYSSLNLAEGHALGMGSGAQLRGSLTLGAGRRLIATGNNRITETLCLAGGTISFGKLGLTVGSLTSTATTTLDVSGLDFTKKGSYKLISYKSQTADTAHLTLQFAEDFGYAYTLQLDKSALTLVLTDAPVRSALASPALMAMDAPADEAAAQAGDAVGDAVGDADGDADGELAEATAEAAPGEGIEQLDAQLGQFNGAQYATAMSSQIEGNLAHLRLQLSRMGSGQAVDGAEGKLYAYVNAVSSYTDIESDAAGSGYTRDEWGGQLGAEYAASRDALFGFAVTASHARISPSVGRRSEEDRSSVDLYALNTAGSWSFRSLVGAGSHRHNFRTDGAGKTRMDGASLNLAEEIACTLQMGDDITLQPYASIESSYNRIDSFREAGAAALCGEDRSAWATDITLGLRYNQQFRFVGNAPRAFFSAHAGATASVGDLNDTLHLHDAGNPGYGFEQNSAKRNRWAARLGASLTIPVTERTSVFATGEALLRGDSTSIDAQMGVQVSF